MNTKTLLAIPFIAALTASGSDNDSSTTQNGTVSILITDDLSLNYTEV